MRRIFEFECSKGHRHEAYTAYEQGVHQCPQCDELAVRVISAPRIQLEGITGNFPSAYDAWSRKHEEATRAAKKRVADHGEQSR